MKKLMTEIKETIGDKIFSVEFIKKDGTVREMTCRFGVTKHLKGGEMSHDPQELGHLVVFDMQKQGYRTINFNTLIRLKCNGQVYDFKAGQNE